MPGTKSSTTKVLLETIQVARHVGRLGMRPVQKVAGQAAQAGEEFAVWALKLQPVQEVVGRHRTKQLLDSYFQAKEVVAESVASLSHQTWSSGLQTGAQYATAALHRAGTNTRVVGPFDEHWNTLRVLKDLRAAERERAARSGHPTLRLTPKRFVQFMRDSERKRRRSQQKDPVEEYVKWMLQTGSLSSMGPRLLEKKLYTDIARLVCFAFDRLCMEANGADFWGHELQVKVRRGTAEADSGTRPRARSAVGVEQVEVIVDRMLRSKDLKVPALMTGPQRQLLLNCSLMTLQLIEDLTSDRHLQISLLGHALGITLEPLPLQRLVDDCTDDALAEEQRFPVDDRAVDELVEALIAEPEVQLVLVPDILEAEVYRHTLHRMICIVQFVLSHMHISLFGNEVRFEITASNPAAAGAEAAEGDEEAACVTQVEVPGEDVQRLLDRLEDERRRVDQELQRRRAPETSTRRHSLDMPKILEDDLAEGVHEFQVMAAQDRLSRSLAVHRTIEVPIELAYSLVSDISEYPKWMPFCTFSKVLGPKDGGNRLMCEVGFGLETGTMLGTLGDTVQYCVTMSAPTDVKPEPSGAGLAQGDDAVRVARVVADTPGGFAYGRRLVYDWRFKEVGPSETDVRLDMFFQAKSLFFLPIWDSMQATVTGAMLQKFAERAEVVMAARDPAAAERARRSVVGKGPAPGEPGSATERGGGSELVAMGGLAQANVESPAPLSQPGPQAPPPHL